MLKRTIRLHLYKLRKYRRELKSHIRGFLCIRRGKSRNILHFCEDEQ